MICHVVFYKMKPGVTAEQQGALVERARQELPRIPGVRNLRTGRSLEGAPEGYSVALVMDFENGRALEAYRVDPDHQRFVKEIAGPLVAETLRFDFVFT